ncbi:MAG: prepilin peptidase [Archaeoglobaceae archaeon]|nr:prepilin peptidase [Archaeoglobaceae archaeon]MCX8152637.1 prepilin peptidase [Archaeoglobaceae archaeon]MDW8014081.1 A24 family peptidase C-terminal domain-containing protein [Archaeoglobaceae archaeon]
MTIVKFFIVLFFLVYACKLDVKSRTVPNRVWKYMLIFSLPITFFELLLFYPSYFLATSVLHMAITISLAYLFYVIGAYGGADAKAIICLAVIFPFYPDPIFPLQKGINVGFSSLANSVILVPALTFAMFFKNLRKDPRGFFSSPLYYFIGYRAKIEKIPKFHNLLEIVENGKLKKLKKGVEVSDENLKKLKEIGVKEVWITPALPFIVFITFGYISTFLFGDFLFFLINFLK